MYRLPIALLTKLGLINVLLMLAEKRTGLDQCCALCVFQCAAQLLREA
jgi:hypothetical protein